MPARVSPWNHPCPLVAHTLTHAHAPRAQGGRVRYQARSHQALGPPLGRGRPCWAASDGSLSGARAHVPSARARGYMLGDAISRERLRVVRERTSRVHSSVVLLCTHARRQKVTRATLSRSGVVQAGRFYFFCFVGQLRLQQARSGPNPRSFPKNKYFSIFPWRTNFGRTYFSKIASFPHPFVVFTPSPRTPATCPSAKFCCPSMYSLSTSKVAVDGRLACHRGLPQCSRRLG